MSSNSGNRLIVDNDRLIVAGTVDMHIAPTGSGIDPFQLGKAQITIRSVQYRISPNHMIPIESIASVLYKQDELFTSFNRNAYFLRSSFSGNYRTGIIGIGEINIVAFALRIEQCYIFVFASGNISHPCYQIFVAIYLTVVRAVLIHFQHLRIGQHFFCKIVQFGHVAAKNKW